MSLASLQRPLRRRLSALSLALASLALAGCSGPMALRQNYIEYAHAQAQVGNELMLLNLARIRNGHPPYFLQMGNIIANYSFSQGTTASYTDAKYNPLTLPHTISRYLSLDARASEAPIFTFSPLSGPAFSNVLLKPVEPRVFSGFAMQGYSMTVLMRMLADDAQLTAAGGKPVELRNVYDANDPDNYADFLRLVSTLYTLQQSRALSFGVDAASGLLRISTDARATPALARLGSPQAVPRLKALGGQPLTAGFSVDVRLRTFVGVLFAMAFDGMVADSLPADFKASLPPEQVDAILRIEASESLSEPETAKLEYAGRKYAISDAPGSMRYRMAFGGLQFVFAQTELNPGQLPQPQIIQAR